MNDRFKDRSIGFLLLLFFMASCSFMVNDNDNEPLEKIKREIHVIDIPGGRDSLITFGSYPKFSFDGRKIIYITSETPDGLPDGIIKTLRIIDIDGKNEKVIVKPFQYLQDVFCSPAGPQLVFSAMDFANHTMDLYLVNEDGTGLKNLTNSINSDEWQPAFSEDGNYITYIQYDRTNYSYKLMIMDFNGNRKTLKISDTNRLVKPKFTLNGKKISSSGF